MSKLNTTQPLSTKMRNWLPLLVRWFIGGFVGYVGSFILFIVSGEGIPPLLSLIFAGQHELFDKIIFFGYFFLYNYYPSSDMRLNTSLMIGSTLWGVIGALIASGRQKQKRFGVILLLLYVVIGGCFFLVWSVLSLAT